MSDSLCVIGRVVKAFGINGEVIVEPMTSHPERFGDLTEVLVGRSAAETATHPIESVRIGRKGIRVLFADRTGRTEAESMIGAYLFVHDSERIALQDGSYFVDDLVGIAVIDEEGVPVGRLAEVMKLPAQDVYVIERDDDRIMMPAVKEFVRSVNLEDRVMVVRLIDGLPTV